MSSLFDAIGSAFAGIGGAAKSLSIVGESLAPSSAPGGGPGLVGALQGAGSTFGEAAGAIELTGSSVANGLENLSAFENPQTLQVEPQISVDVPGTILSILSTPVSGGNFAPQETSVSSVAPRPSTSLLWILILGAILIFLLVVIL